MRQPRTPQDTEISVLGQMVALMEKIPDDASRGRVIEYLDDRFTPRPVPPAGLGDSTEDTSG